ASVLGTDISRVRLASAQRAIYTKWSLRGLTDSTIGHYFTQRGSAHTVRPEFREHVDFRYLNLADDHYPSLTAGIWGMDIILCRNVLIYFDHDTIARVARRLIDSLSEDGWLLLGASDPAISDVVECEVVLTRSGLAYRKPGRGGSGRHTVPAYVGEQPWLETPQDRWVVDPPQVGAPAALDPAVADGAQEWWAVADDVAAVEAGTPGELPSADLDAPAVDAAAAPVWVTGAAVASGRAVPDTVQAAYGARDYARAAELATQLMEAHDCAELRVLHIRALANLGDLAGAGRVTAAALEKYRASAELMYLHAVLLSEAGRWRDAAAAARRALYLDRTLVVAHFALAGALRRAGDDRGARRALCNADALLADWPLDVVVPATDGETVERLRANVRTQLRLMESAA
ncbi:MAG: CheR family methyltransferase, partial [Longimicrobiales bacterium]